MSFVSAAKPRIMSGWFVGALLFLVVFVGVGGIVRGFSLRTNCSSLTTVSHVHTTWRWHSFWIPVAVVLMQYLRMVLLRLCSSCVVRVGLFSAGRYAGVICGWRVVSVTISYTWL